MNIKKGLHVKTRQDLQNLVTSTILREDNVFTLESIKVDIKKQLEQENDLWSFSEQVLNDCVKDTIEVLQSSNAISNVDGKFTKNSILM